MGGSLTDVQSLLSANGPQDLIDQLTTLDSLGAQNTTALNRFKAAEVIAKANPSVIFLADTKCCAVTKDVVSKRPGWSGIDAVKNGNIVELDDDIASRWGPRVLDLITSIRDAVAAANS